MSNAQADADIQVMLVPAERIPSVWVAFEDQILEALAHGAGDSTDAGSVLRHLMAGDSVMLAAGDADRLLGCLTYSVKQYERKTTVFVEFIAGQELDRWVEAMETVLKAVRDNADADTIEGVSRPGMAKLLKHWRRKAVIMEYQDG